MVPSRPFLYLSLPGLALMFGLLWLRRRKSEYNGKTNQSKNSNDIENNLNNQDQVNINNLSNPDQVVKHSEALEITSNVKRINKTKDIKLAKSAPIDIIPNGKTSTPPIHISNKEIDLEILKVKITESNQSLTSIEEEMDSISSVDLPGTINNKKFSFKKVAYCDTDKTIIVKAKSRENISPNESFIENKYTEECQIINDIDNNDKIDKLNTEEYNTNNKIEQIEHENINNNNNNNDDNNNNDYEDGAKCNEVPEIINSSPPGSICSVKSADSEKVSIKSADSGKGSSIPKCDENTTIYQFIIPNIYIGLLLGKHRSNVNNLESNCGVNIILKKYCNKKNSKICIIEGTPKDINEALRLIRLKFPEKHYPLLTLEKLEESNEYMKERNVVESVNFDVSSLQLKLIEGINNDVRVSCVISGSHIFVQLPLHPTYYTLNLLQNSLNEVYSGEAPYFPELADNAICVGFVFDQWYRIQVIQKYEDKQYLVKLIDIGGYYIIPHENMRQIRTDFMTTPFQAIECVLANVEPIHNNEWTTPAVETLCALTAGNVLQAQIVGYTDDKLPKLHLFACIGPNKVVFLNKELVGRKLAKWTES